MVLSNLISRLGAALCLVVAVALSIPAAATRQEDAKDKQETSFDALSYRHVGPIGNRVSAVVGVSSDINTYLVGAASGGIFKTIDGGAHFKPVFDDAPVQSIGALAIAKSDPNVIWAGTGEAKIRSNISVGAGIYKSTDGGESFQFKGLEQTGRISRIAIHPSNPEIVYAAALGHSYGPQAERGVFRTTDGGENWKRVLFVDENTGASDLVMDPNNPRVLFAGMWQLQIWTWGRESGGAGSGLHVTRDGGEHWDKLEGNGLPPFPWGKVALSMSARDSNRVYALIETNVNQTYEEFRADAGVLWRSDDGGRKWNMTNADHTLVQRPHYYSRAVAAPDDADEIHFLATQHSTSLDGGKTFFRNDAGGDHHDMWIDPELPDRMIVGHDQGISISTNRGESWFRPQLPIAQMYHVYTDQQIPYFLYGNRQDGPSFRGPSNTLMRGSIPIGAWHSVGGCESGFAIPDPVENHFVWSGCYEGILERYDLRTGHARNVSVWPDNPEGWAAQDLRYRFQWTFPVAISPHDHKKVYAGSQHVHQTTNGGESWTVMSPDLTGNDPEKQQKTGGLTPDDVSPTYASVLFAIAESPVQEGLIWAGSNDGYLQLTRDGEVWENVSGNLPKELPPWGTVSNIEPSRFSAGAAYVSFDLHQVNNTEPFIFKTDDFGHSFRRITDGIPKSTHSYVHVVREDPTRAGLLYAGTENGVYVSFDDGNAWRPLQSNLPHAPAHWLTIQEHFNDLVISTYGRGFWILDDLTPVQQWNETVSSSSVHLFDPRPAYRFRFKEASVSQPQDPAAGDNPDYGASLHYFLGEDLEGSAGAERETEASEVSNPDVPTEGDEQLVIEIFDQEDNLVRRFSSANDEGELPTTRGLHRFMWDLRWERSKQAKLRTKPEEHTHVSIPDNGWRELVEGSRVAPLVAPGTYAVRLKAGGGELSRSLEVRKDPNSAGTDLEVREQVGVLLRIRDHINEVVDMVNEIEWMRKQIDDLENLLEARDTSELKEPIAALDETLRTLEARFFDLRLTGGSARQDSLRWPRRLYSKLSSLVGYIGGTDFPPTEQHMEVLGLYEAELSDCRRELVRIREEDLSRLNQRLVSEELPRIVDKLR